MTILSCHHQGGGAVRPGRKKLTHVELKLGGIVLALKAPGQRSSLRAWGNNAYRNSNHLPKKIFLEEGMKKTLWNFEGRARFTRREGESRLGNFFKKNFFQGSIYKVAGGGYFTTFLKQNFENLICDGKLRKEKFFLNFVLKSGPAGLFYQEDVDKNVYELRRFTRVFYDDFVKSGRTEFRPGIRFCQKALTFLSASIVGQHTGRNKKREVKPLL